MRHPTLGAVPLRVLQIRGDRIAVVASCPNVPKAVQCSFVHTGPPQGHIELVASLVQAKTERGKTCAELRVLLVFAPAGRSVLTPFLRDVLGVVESRAEQFAPRADGTVFAFEPKYLPTERKKAAEPPTQPLKRAEDAKSVVERRWQDRFATQMPIQVVSAVGRFDAHLIQVSRYGVRLETTRRVPPVDTSVELRLRVQAGRISVPVQATCTIRWVAVQGGEGGPVVSGLQVDRVDDGSHGRRWEHWLESLAEGPDVEFAFARGTEVPSSAIREPTWRAR